MMFFDDMFSAHSGCSTQAGAPASLNIAALYQDSQCRKWITDFCDQVAAVVHEKGCRPVYWSVADLTDADGFLQAGADATSADVIIISLHAADQLPPRVQAWVRGWLLCRERRPGTMIAVIGLPPHPDVPSEYVQEYLAAAARRGGLDFLLRELKLPPNSPSAEAWHPPEQPGK